MDKPAAEMPETIRVHRTSKVVELKYKSGKRYTLPFEYLRVYSPSAEVRGHGDGEPRLVPGKRKVGIKRVEPIGRYAVQIVFDDGHDSGLYSWDVFEELGHDHDQLWARYLERLQQQGLSRDSSTMTLAALRNAPPTKPRFGKHRPTG
ncbi:MAG TPA: DUF971 domain-containing protein [Nevskiaceae bacterium]